MSRVTWKNAVNSQFLDLERSIISISPQDFECRPPTLGIAGVIQLQSNVNEMTGIRLTWAHNTYNKDELAAVPYTHVREFVNEVIEGEIELL